VVDLPEATLEHVELAVDKREAEDLVRRAGTGEDAPTARDPLLRYLVYLGAACLEAESAVDKAASWEEAYDALHRRYGAAYGELSVLRFHYSQESRRFATSSALTGRMPAARADTRRSSRRWTPRSRSARSG